MTEAQWLSSAAPTLKRKRRLLAVAALVGLVVVILGVKLAFRLAKPPKPCINEGTFEEISFGMKKPELEELLGKPNGVVSIFSDSKRYWYSQMETNSGKRKWKWPDVPHEAWEGDEWAIGVWYDDQGKVQQISLYHQYTILTKLDEWFWKIGRW